MKIPASILLVLFLKIAAYAQFPTGVFADTKTNTSYRYITINGLDWMQEDIKAPMPDTTDIFIIGQRFIKRNAVEKFIPEGWRLPTLQEIRQLITALEGERNSTGGKTLDSVYLQTIFPFSFNGIFYANRKVILGNGYMTAFYTATDTLHTFRGKTESAQVAIHVYSNSRGKVNFEPTFSHSPIYCRVRLVRTSINNNRKK